MNRSKVRSLWPAAVLLFAVTLLHAQDFTGTWQGTLGTENKFRVVLQIEKAEGTWKGTAYSLDPNPTGVPFTTVTISGNSIKFTVDQFSSSYEGTLSPDTNSITGTVNQGTPVPLNFERATKATAWQIDPSPHKAQFIPVEGDIKLEVLDWGGTGRPLVLLTGLGDNAHVFDKFAPKLTANYHVYGITRRGFGASSTPSPATASYAANRLGDDVLVVIDTLKISRPILVGHSLAGEELTSIGTRHPEKIAALIYLDAGYPYALYDLAHGNMLIDSIEVREQINQIFSGKPPADQKQFVDNLLAEVQHLEKDLQQQQQDMQAVPPPPPPSGPRPTPPPAIPAIMSGEQRYTAIPNVPILAIFADPHNLGPAPKDHPEVFAARETMDKRNVENQATAFETQVPGAKVVRIPHANHYVYRSNEADVLREMNTFIATLP
jgi:non-heme chloroperoxidase